MKKDVDNCPSYSHGICDCDYSKGCKLMPQTIINPKSVELEQLEVKTPIEIFNDFVNIRSVTIDIADNIVEAIEYTITQQKNQFISILQNRMGYYGNKGATSKTEENKDFAIWDELNHILTILNK